MMNIFSQATMTETHNKARLTDALKWMVADPVASNYAIRNGVGVHSTTIQAYRDIFTEQVQPQLPHWEASETDILAKIAHKTTRPLTPEGQREIDGLYHTLAHKRRAECTRRGAKWRGRIHLDGRGEAMDEFRIGLTLKDNRQALPMIRYWHGFLCHAPLIEVSRDGKLLRYTLAEKVDHENFSDWSITLKKGLRFSNGQRIAKAHILKSLDRLIRYDSGTVTADGENRYRIQLDRPHPFFLAQLGYTSIRSGRAGVVTGAYQPRPQNLRRDKTLKLNANPHYHEPIHTRNIRLTCIAEEDRAIYRLDRNEIDLLILNFLTAGKQSTKYIPQVMPNFDQSHFLLFLNRNRKHFADVANCEALKAAIDFEAVEAYLESRNYPTTRRKKPIGEINFHTVYNPSDLSNVANAIGNAIGIEPQTVIPSSQTWEACDMILLRCGWSDPTQIHAVYHSEGTDNFFLYKNADKRIDQIAAAKTIDAQQVATQRFVKQAEADYLFIKIAPCIDYVYSPYRLPLGHEVHTPSRIAQTLHRWRVEDYGKDSKRAWSHLIDENGGIE